MSAMVVRELFAKLGLDTDMSSFKRGDAALKGVEKTAFSVGDAFKFIGAAAAAAFAVNVVKAASSAEENLNVINASFGSSAESVLAWAETTGAAMGRSQYAMREMAASLGAILHPTLQNDEAAAKLSTTLAGLAVDLSSFFDTTESDALAALRSGLLGESEPLRKFGVTLNDVRLKEEARALGLAKGNKPLTGAIKAQAAYSLIMKDTEAAQGDAIKTGNTYANMVRRLEGAWTNMKIAMGNVLLGPAGALLKWLVGAAEGATKLISQSNILQAALIAIGAALVPFIGAWIAANAPLLLAAAALAAIVLVIEDIYTMMTGGKSVIDDWFAAMLGKDHWAEIKKTWQEEFEGLLGDVFKFAKKAGELAEMVWHAMKGDTKFFAKFEKGTTYLSNKPKPQGPIAPTGINKFFAQFEKGTTYLSNGSASKPALPASVGAAAPATTSTKSITLPTTIIVNGARDAGEVAREVRKHQRDRDRELHRTASGSE